jgi:phenylalanine aminomutase (D-beta-phenylalanine forming)
MTFILDGGNLNAEIVSHLARTKGSSIAVGDHCRSAIQASRRHLEERVRKGEAVYGATTGVGGFAGWLLSLQQAKDLQNNLIAAVASNVGSFLSEEVVRAAMLARVNSLSRGHSAIRLIVVEHLVNMFNRGVTPCVPSLGSLGASGDLGPLGYIALVATGRWRASVKGQEMDGSSALACAGLYPLELSYKEGLSLINGTSMMTGLGALNVADARKLLTIYLRVSALCLEVLCAKTKPFAPALHEMKNHPGQSHVALRLHEFLRGSRLAGHDDELSQLLNTERAAEPSCGSDAIEDCYSLRCTPQVVGPIFDTLEFVSDIVNRELNATSDNPVVLPDTGEVFHGGHFHGQYVSMAMDYLATALTTLSNLSDRRIDRLLTPHYNMGLPPFLCRENPGIRLGLMGAQFMATSVTAENRALCHPVSIQTLPSTGGFQDHVSMGLVAARKCLQIFENTAYVVACELLCACQAADLRGPDLLSPASRALWSEVRCSIPYLDHDTIMTTQIEQMRALFSTLADLQDSVLPTIPVSAPH